MNDSYVPSIQVIPFSAVPEQSEEVFCLLKKVVMPANREEIG